MGGFSFDLDSHYSKEEDLFIMIESVKKCTNLVF